MNAIARRMLDAASNEDDAHIATVKRLGLIAMVHTVIWSEGVSSGVVEIEAAAKADYAGTWASVATVTFSAPANGGPKVDVVTGVVPYPVIRHRISTIVTDGTVTSRLDGSD